MLLPNIVSYLKEATMGNQKAYLIIATYNRNKWHKASPAQLEAAEHAAEDLFPEYANSRQLQELERQGEFMPHTFASDLFDKLADSYGKIQATLQTALEKGIAATSVNTLTAVQQQLSDIVTEIPRGVRDQIIDGIYATQPLEVPVGWMVVVDASAFPSYIERMSGKGSEKGLWPVFDIEIIPLAEGWTEPDVLSKVPPLRDDQTTEEIYRFMTPRSWN
jgi:hypothetical protein